MTAGALAGEVLAGLLADLVYEWLWNLDGPLLLGGEPYEILDTGEGRELGYSDDEVDEVILIRRARDGACFEITVDPRARPARQPELAPV